MRLVVIAAILVFLGAASSCSYLKSTVQETDKDQAIELTKADNDSTEYELVVMDPGFESWFVKNRKQKGFHTKEILEVKNWNYVLAWNRKVRDGQFQMLNPRNPFDLHIDYKHGVDYGMDVNYKLFYYFKFIEDTWGKF